MKKAAKVFLILGMVVQAILIYPIILGIFAIKKIDNAQSKNDLTAWGIISIFFVSTVGGILMLLIPEEEYSAYAYYRAHHQGETYDTPKSNGDNYIQRIKDLKELLDSGAITQEEYDKLKAEELERY